jgi:signal transduction histidine kinase
MEDAVNNFLPHGYCLVWQPELVLLHLIADGFIALSYYSIPVALAYFVAARKDLAYGWMVKLFGAFIFACGTTHWMNIVTLWQPVYWLDGGVKLATAGVSLVTAALLWPLIPKALAFPSPSDLAKANQELQQQIRNREQAEEALRQLNEELEKRVAERTAELSRLNEELARSNKELEQFTYMASHDLQEPLRTVTVFAQLLTDRYKGQLDEKADKFIDYILGGAQHMSELIQALFTYSRVGTQAQKAEPVDSNSVLEQTLANLQAVIKDNGAVIVHEPLPTVSMAGSQLGQLFQNLISNAIKFRSEKPPYIQISAEPKEQAWQFAVADNGIGINPEFAERIFVIFQRLHTRQKYPGTGLGLAVCKKVVEKYGGRIWVESQPGQGAIFYFTVPLRLTDETHPD